MRTSALAMLGLLMVGPSVSAMSIVTFQKNVDGTESSVTYNVGDSFAYQVFRGAISPTMVTDGVTVAQKQISSFTDKAGNVFTIGPAGEIYRNAIRLVTLSSTGAVQKMIASRIVSVGPEIYALGKTDGKWWHWEGTALLNKWTLLSPGDFDSAILFTDPLPQPSAPLGPAQ